MGKGGLLGHYFSICTLLSKLFRSEKRMLDIFLPMKWKKGTLSVLTHGFRYNSFYPATEGLISSVGLHLISLLKKLSVNHVIYTKMSWK